MHALGPALAFALSLLAAGAAAAQTRALAPGGAARFQGWSPLSDYVVAGLGEGGSFRLTVPTRAGNVEVALHPSTVEAAAYHGEEASALGLQSGRARPELRTFAGTVAHGAGEPPARRRGGDFARLALEPGGRLSGLMRVDGVLYDLAADAAAGDLVLHVREVTREELASALAACGGAPDDAVSAPEPGAGESDAAPASEPAGALREIELGTEADAPFVARAGGVAAANAKILSLVNSVNGIYETDLGLTNRVVFQRAWNGTDPYTTNDSDRLLEQFRSSFLADVAARTDEAQLFSGRDFENNTLGRAFIGSTCTSYRFGVSQYSQDAITRLVVAHEMGHNLGGTHTSEGIMSPSVNANAAFFSNGSRSEIAGYLAGVSCLGPAGTGGGAPVIDPIGPQSVSENEILTLRLAARDPDGDPIEWSAAPLPSGATLSRSGSFSWRPALATVGCGRFADRSVTFTAIAADGSRASETVVISVLDAPSGAAPVLADPPDRSVAPGRAFSLPLSATDADGDSVRFSAAGLPNGAALSAAGVFSWTPAAAQAGTHAITFTATDCTGRRASQSVSLSVGTSAPVLSGLSAARGAKGDWLTLTGQNLAGKKVKVFFGPRKAKAREVTATSLRVKVPKKSKKIPGSQVAVSVVRDGVASTNGLSFTWVERPK